MGCGFAQLLAEIEEDGENLLQEFGDPDIMWAALEVNAND